LLAAAPELPPAFGALQAPDYATENEMPSYIESTNQTREKKPRQTKWVDQQFQLKDKDSEQPMSNTKYRIVTADGKEYTGTTDDEGKTERIYNANMVGATIYYEDEEAEETSNNV
jgi:hypothetical protein